MGIIQLHVVLVGGVTLSARHGFTECRHRFTLEVPVQVQAQVDLRGCHFGCCVAIAVVARRRIILHLGLGIVHLSERCLQVGIYQRQREGRGSDLMLSIRKILTSDPKGMWIGRIDSQQCFAGRMIRAFLLLREAQGKLGGMQI